MSNELATRAYIDHDKKRTTMRLDAATWNAIDALAADAGTDWETWLNSVPVVHTSRTTDVRQAVVEELQARRESAFARALGQPLKDDSGHLLTGDPMLMEAAPLTDAELKAELAPANAETQVERGTYEFRGFQVRTGTRHGRPCYWIINGVRGGAHLALPIPSWISSNQRRAGVKDQEAAA
jgi:hypothetical protein